MISKTARSANGAAAFVKKTNGPFSFVDVVDASKKIFLPEGAVPKEGEMLVQKDLAAQQSRHHPFVIRENLKDALLARQDQGFDPSFKNDTVVRQHQDLKLRGRAGGCFHGAPGGAFSSGFLRSW